MIAWTIWLSTYLFGQNELAVRLPTNIGVTVAFFYMALLAARMFSWRTAFHVILLCQAILLFNGAALIATPDGMLLPCWAGATFHAAQALRGKQFGRWLATGRKNDSRIERGQQKNPDAGGYVGAGNTLR